MFATHAREILADLRTARSAVAALRALSNQSLLVHTTPGIGATLFPRVLTDVLARFPAATVTLAERDWSADAAGVPHDAVLVVAPADRPSSPAARRQILWWEPLRLVVPNDHDLARIGAPVSPCRLAEQRLLVSSTAGRVLAAATDLPAECGALGRPRVTVDAPASLGLPGSVGLGLGVVGASSTALLERTGLTALPFDTGARTMGFEVAADWYDVLLESPAAGPAGAVLPPVPAGAVAAGP